MHVAGDAAALAVPTVMHKLLRTWLKQGQSPMELSALCMACWYIRDHEVQGHILT